MNKKNEMKIVTYNVNGLRPRISQHGSLLKLLDSFDADVICFQETKLRRQELTADLVAADGYESFFSSCTSSSDSSCHSGYSGVATFCRVKSAFSSEEAALPVAAEEGFTGVLDGSCSGRGEMPAVATGLEEFERDELLRVDGEGRCVITDHTHFVLFNVYGPRAESDDSERIEFKLKFFKIMQKRWESLLREGRRVVVVGDLNIAPTKLDRCDAGLDFENNERDAHTCWPQNTGAEEFNYGTRIDHILCAGSCLHQEQEHEGYNFFTCHVNDCDILTQYKQWKPGNTLSHLDVDVEMLMLDRWKGGQRIKLEGSDHAPVFTSLVQIPCVPQHSTPSLSCRYIPMVYGVQQTLVSALIRRQVSKKSKSYEVSSSSTDEDITLGRFTEGEKRAFDECSLSGVPLACHCSFSSQEFEVQTSREDMDLGSGNEVGCETSSTPNGGCIRTVSGNQTKKKAKKNQWSQLTLTSFFQKSSIRSNSVDNGVDSSTNEASTVKPNHQSNDPPIGDDQTESISQSDSPHQCDWDQDGVKCSSKRNSVALVEWQRIQQMMQNSIPLCKGHKEPCVAQVVKKQGPNFGRRFDVPARAEVFYTFDIQLSLKKLVQICLSIVEENKLHFLSSWITKLGKNTAKNAMT